MHDGHLLSNAFLHVGMVQPALWAIFETGLGSSEYCGTRTPSWCLGFWSYRPNFACFCNVDDPACTGSIFEAGSGALQYLATSWCLGICNHRSPFSDTDPCYKQPASVMTEPGISIQDDGGQHYTSGIALIEGVPPPFFVDQSPCQDAEAQFDLSDKAVQ